MAFEVSQLEARIRNILKAPGIDLATISAKRVRRRLMEEDSNLTADVVKDHKDEIDKLIGTVYEEVSSELQGEQDGGDEDGEDEGEEEPEDSEEAGSSKPAKKAKRPRKSGAELTDAELARKLSSELNGRPRTAKKTSGTKPKRGTKRKSAEVVNSDGELDPDAERPKKRGGGFSKEYALSEPLAALLSVEKMSRPQVVKNLWVHIRGAGLQNPADKREIICDERLKAVFGVDKMNMFAMNKMLGQHLYEVEA